MATQSPQSLQDWLTYIERQHPKSIAMGLDRVREVATRMGLSKPARHVITVGGTNGKGSTVAFIEAIANESGWRVGAYTSPHLLHYNERVRIEGKEVTDDALISAFKAVEVARGGRPSSGATRHLLPEGEGKSIPLTYFEFGTLAALWLFELRDLDLAILEVGLGGRLDAVNIVDPDVAVITTVDLDHQDWLGDDREKIGFEKAGIARAWKPLILGDDDPPSSVLGHAYAIGASAVRIGCDFFFEPIDTAHWRWREIGCELELSMPVMPATVQLRNAAVAIAALRALPLDDDLTEHAIISGVSKARANARMQRFERGGIEILVDVAHNPQAAAVLADWLAVSPIAGSTHAVFAALGDKDIVGVVGVLSSQIDCWWLAGLSDVSERGIDVDAFAEQLRHTAAANAERRSDVSTALTTALEDARKGDRILVFGSFHTAAAAMRMLNG